MTQSISLYFVGGGSDKEYHAQLETVQNGYVVNFQYGRRGGTLKSDTKTKTPITLDEAQKIFDKLVKEKRGKGYEPDVNNNNQAQQFVSVAASKVDSGYHPQLLNPCEKVDALECINDNDWIAQEKFDGDRRLMHFELRELKSINRKGEYVGLPAETCVDIIDSFKINQFVLDGELINNKFYVFDILMWDCNDIRDKSVKERYSLLSKVINANKNSNVVLAKTAFTKKEKKELFNHIFENKGEGIVFKKADSTYISGRPNSGGDQLKFKFWKTATFKVGSLNNKRSVGLELLNEKSWWTEVGNVTIPVNADIPDVGELIEVRYLYAYKGGSVYQPTYIGKRNDLDLSACDVKQLVYKVELSEIDSVKTVLNRINEQIKEDSDSYSDGYLEYYPETIKTMIDNMELNPGKYVHEYFDRLEKGLEHLALNDFFGTERQCDPRGDGRNNNNNWSMSDIEMS